MELGALELAVAALGVAVAVLAAACAWLMRERVARTTARQSEQDLLAENLVHALAELTLRVDALSRELRDAAGSGGADGAGTSGGQVE